MYRKGLEGRTASSFSSFFYFVETIRYTFKKNNIRCYLLLFWGYYFAKKKTKNKKKLTVSYLLKLLEKVSFHFLKILLAFKANANHNCISCLHFLSAFTTIAVRMEKNINSVPFKQWQSKFKIKIFLLFEQCIFYLDSINVDFFFFRISTSSTFLPYIRK